MKDSWKWVFFVVLLAAVEAAVLCRYSVTSVSGHDAAIGLRLDRWTGKVAVVGGAGIRVLQEVE